MTPAFPLKKQEVEESPQGLTFERHFTSRGKDPYSEIKWTKRSSVIKEPDGTVVFEMHDIEIPESWSQLATDIVAQKYFRKAGVPDEMGGRDGREVSVRQTVYRVAH